VQAVSRARLNKLLDCRTTASPLVIALTKILIYAIALVLGVFFGLLLSGRHLRLTTTIDGVPISNFTGPQLEEALRRSATGFQNFTSVIVDDKTIFTVGGQWLMWAVVLGIIATFIFLAHLLIKWRLRKRM
jgi:hypothetical protein